MSPEAAKNIFIKVNETYTPCLIDIQKPYLMFAQHKVLPVIYSVGFVGNLLIIVISQMLKPKSVVNLLLKTLAIFDMLYLVFVFAESMAALHNKSEIMEEPGWFWMLSSQEAFYGPDWKPPSLFNAPSMKCQPNDHTMQIKYMEFNEKYSYGCGTSVTDFVKLGLHSCELMERMTRLYRIEDEDELVNAIYWLIDVDIARNCSFTYNRTDQDIVDRERVNLVEKHNESIHFNYLQTSLSLRESIRSQLINLNATNQTLSLAENKRFVERMLPEVNKAVFDIFQSLTNGLNNRSISIAADMDKVILGLKRSWTKSRLCFAYFMKNLTEYMDRRLAEQADAVDLKALGEVSDILKVQYHSIFKGLPELSQRLLEQRHRFIGDNGTCDQLMYSITAPAYDEIEKEIAKYEAYLASLITNNGVMMLDWYIRHTLLFEGNTKDARSIYLTVFATKIIARTFQFASACQTVVIALFRYIAICMPYSASKLCTYRNAMVACFFSFFSAVMIHVPHYVLIAADYDSTAAILHITGNASFSSFFTGYHVCFYNILMFFAVPFGLLAFFNIRLIQALYWHAQQVCPNPSRDKENREVTKTVVAVVLVYVITYVPLPIYIIDKWFFKNGIHLTMVKENCFFFLGINFIIWSFPSINSSVNFFIYYLLRSSFKAKVQEIMSIVTYHLRCACPCTKPRNKADHIKGFNNKLNDSLSEQKSK